MNFIKYLLFSVSLLIAAGARADAIEGTWKYEKTTDYFGMKMSKQPRYTTIIVADSAEGLQGNCVAKMRREDFLYSDTFQPMLKEDVSRAQMDVYFQKVLQFPLASTRHVYTLTGSPGDCHKPLLEFLIAGGRLIVPVGGSIFHSYVRAPTGQVRTAMGFKLSSLPFKMSAYAGECAWNQTAQKCAPSFFPYMATKKSTEAVGILVGHHDYSNGRPNFDSDYINPVSHDLHPVFLVFPPRGDVMLVRVDDVEPGDDEQRDTISGVFLAIKGGKVSDQLNEGCNITADYFCVDDDGRKQYELLETGKFKKLN